MSDIWGTGTSIWEGGSGNYGDSGSFDWGSVWGGGDSAWGSSSSSGSSGGFWSGILSGVSSWFGDDDDNGNSSSWWNAASGVAGAYLSKEAMEEKGKQDRQTTAFEAELADYYKQKDKQRKRVALDTYGQFSLMNRWAPNATAAPALDTPAKPNP